LHRFQVMADYISNFL